MEFYEKVDGLARAIGVTTSTVKNIIYFLKNMVITLNVISKDNSCFHKMI